MSAGTAASAKKISKAQEKALLIRDAVWPEISEADLWSRKKHVGFTSIPRTMPLLINIIDALSKNKPAGQTYFVLWCRSFDESLLVIDNPASYASESGFTGERAISTWQQRMKTLRDLEFIDAKDGSSGAFHYVLIRNPHMVVWKLKPKIPLTMFRQLHERAIEIGAKDMAAPPASPKPAAPSKKQ